MTNDTYEMSHVNKCEIRSFHQVDIFFSGEENNTDMIEELKGNSKTKAIPLKEKVQFLILT